MLRTLREVREENKKTVAEVAQVLGVSTTVIYQYESGARLINIYQIQKLALLYNESADEIINAQIMSRASNNQKARLSNRK